MRRVKLKSLIWLFFLPLLFIAFPAIAQNYLYGTGNQTWGINIPIENGYINVANGELHLEIPLSTLPQRGSVPLQESLVYDSRIWHLVGIGSGYSFIPDNVLGTVGGFNSTGGWRFVTNNNPGAITHNPLGNVYFWTYTDQSGATHSFDFLTAAPSCDDQCGQPTSNSGYALDGSGYFMSVTNSSDALVYDSSGNEVAPQAIDRNGNSYSVDSNLNLIDTLGRTPVVQSTSGNNVFYDVLTIGGATKRYTVTMEQISVVAPTQSGVYSGSYTLNVIQSITLPDGSQYSFTYDTPYLDHGALMSMTLPTGGVVNFEWMDYLDSYQNVNNWLDYYSGAKGTYSFIPSVVTQCSGPSEVGCQEMVSVVNGGVVNYLLTLNNGAWNTRMDFYDGQYNTGNQIERASTATTYNFSNSCPPGLGDICTGSVWATASNTTTTLSDTGQTAQTQYTFTYPWSGKPSTIQQWDYYTGTPSSVPTTETDYTYGTLVNGAYYPTQINQLDSTGTLAAQQVLTYDQWTPATAPGAANLSPAPGGAARGNLTTKTSGVGSTVTTTSTYDTAGQKVTDVDGNTHTTSYLYQCSDAYLGTIISPVVVNGAHLQTQSNSDCSSGLITSTQDENGVVTGKATSFTYYTSGSNIGKLQQIAYPDNGGSSYTYPSTLETDITTLQNASTGTNILTQSILDQFGRSYQIVTVAPEGNITSETTYDSSGRPNCVTTAHLATSSPTDGTTCKYYDVLGRLTQTTMADGNSITATYSGPTQTVTDEIGNVKQYTYDAFHRLKKVMEPNPAGALAYETDYLYDTQNNLIEADQWGATSGSSSPGDRQRLFAYDSLGRKIAENVPESQSVGSPASQTCPGAAPGSKWTTCYSYDPNGNITSTTDNAGNVVNYTFDALNRPLSESQASGGVSYSYQYDGTDGYSHTNPLGKLTYSVNNNASAGASLSYDSMGRLTNQNDCLPTNCTFGAAGINVSATYDLAGNVNSLTYPDSRSVSQSFDSANRLTGVQCTNWCSPSVGAPYFSTSTFAPAGQPTNSVMGNGVAIASTYTDRQSIASLAYSGSSGPLWSKQYSWDKNASNLLLMVDGVTGYGRQFTYDTLNRLVTAQDIAVNNSTATKSTSTITIGGGPDQYYTECRGRCCGDCEQRYDTGTVTVTVNGVLVGSGRYDDGDYSTPPQIAADLVASINGNSSSPVTASYAGSGNSLTLTSVNGGSSSNYPLAVSVASTDPTDFGSGSFTVSASGPYMTGGSGTPPPTNDLNQTFAYDPFGNFTQSGSYGFSGSFNSNNQINSYSYDANGNQNSTALNQQLSFDANGMLASMPGIESYVYDAQANRVEVHGPTITDYVYFGGRPVAILSGGVYTDLIYAGSTLLAEVAGTQSAAPTYRVTDHLQGLGGSLQSASSLSNAVDYAPYGQQFSGTTSDPFGFAGLQWDPTTFTYHATARQFSIAQGRWQSPDLYEGSYDWSDPQSLNRYAYVNGRPTIFTDPSGQDFGDGLGASIHVLGGALIMFGLYEDITELFGLIWGQPNLGPFKGSPEPRPGSGPVVWTQNDTFGIPNPGLGPALGGAAGGSIFGGSGGCEFGACASSFGPGSWSSGAYPNGNDPNDLNLLGGLWDGVKSLFQHAQPSAACIAKATSAAAHFPSPVTPLDAAYTGATATGVIGLGEKAFTKGGIYGIVFGPYVRYSLRQSAYTTVLRDCQKNGG